MMKQALKFLLLINIAALLAGCRLAVIVAEGGEVQSSGSGTCVASSICIVDVDDQYFAESFTAVPDTDWYFKKWNSGDGFFCGGSTDPTCTLSFQGHEESKGVADMVASSETFYLMPVFRPYPDIITVDGKEWLQPYLFTNLTWNDINAVCPEGICAGNLNGYDMTGWTWASADDLNALFNHYIGSDILGPGPDFTADFPGVSESSVFSDFFGDGWHESARVPEHNVRILRGWLLSTDEILAYQGEVFAEGVYEITGTFNSGASMEVDSESGGWFYRNH